LSTICKHLKFFWLGLALVITFSSVLAGCSANKSTATPTVQVPAATNAAPTTPVNPSFDPTQGFGRGQGANGTLSSISGNILTLATSQGQVTVIASASTPVEKTVTGALSDLQVGQFVTVIGTADANGVIAATAIDARSQGARLQFTPPPGASPRPSRAPVPNSSNTPNFANGRNGLGTIGTISSISGNTLVLTVGQGQVTINTGSNTVIQKTVAGTVSDLQVGDFLTVIGSADANGNITATSVMVRPQGQGVPGFTQ
jgi:hypothetical protein